jgi:hypothetical protein
MPPGSTILAANFATGVNDTGGNLSLVLLKPVANNGNIIRLVPP